jgi:hypothetical protein
MDEDEPTEGLETEAPVGPAVDDPEKTPDGQRDWLSEAQKQTAATITDSDVGWAGRAFLSIVMVSAKFGRRAGEAQLAKLAAERREQISQSANFQRSVPTPAPVLAAVSCTTCGGRTVQQEIPGFRDPAAMAKAGIENKNAYLKVVRCLGCNLIVSAEPR